MSLSALPLGRDLRAGAPEQGFDFRSFGEEAENASCAQGQDPLSKTSGLLFELLDPSQSIPGRFNSSTLDRPGKNRTINAIPFRPPRQCAGYITARPGGGKRHRRSWAIAEFGSKTPASSENLLLVGAGLFKVAPLDNAKRRGIHVASESLVHLLGSQRRDRRFELLVP